MAPAAARLVPHIADGDALEQALQLRKELDIEAARKDPVAFIEYAIPHEKTGKAIDCAPFQREWQDIITAHKKIVIQAAIEHGKTTQIPVGRLLWELGNDPTLRVGLISNTAGQAEKVLGLIAQHIKHNKAVREVFPHLKPSTLDGAPWNNSAITIERPNRAKDPTITAVGITAVQNGSRWDKIVLDDILDFENTRTKAQRDLVMDRYESVVERRLTEDGTVWIVGTPWAEDDFQQEIAKRPGWFAKTYPAVENPDDPPETWRPIWHPLKRLQDAFASTTPHNFYRKFFCRVTNDETSRFQGSWIQLALALGKGRKLMDRAPITPSGRRLPCFTGVDIGVGQKQENDLTVLFTLALDERGRRIPVDIQSGRWQGPEILQRIQRVAHQYDAMVTVENNAAQDFIRQFGALQGIPIRPHTTGSRNKHDEAFGVESMAVEFRSGLWVVPSGATGADIDPEIQQWLAELRTYHPDRHSGDRLMASWIAREAARKTNAGIVQRGPDTLRR